MRTIFRSTEFWAPENRGNKAKTPFEFVVSCLRVTGARLEGPKAIATLIGEMGMPLLGSKAPTGYSNRGSDWLNASSQVRRFDSALKLAQGRLEGAALPPDSSAADLDPDDPEGLTRRLNEQWFGGGLSRTTVQVASSLRAGDGVPVRARVMGLLLASPEFQMR
jgi:hypothetical protein